jgi:hypothetical protein
MSKLPSLIFERVYSERTDIFLFLKKYYNESLDSEKWIWEYLSPPKQSITNIALMDDNIIGHFSLILFQWVINGKVILGAKAEGSCVNINALRRIKEKPQRDVFGKLVLLSLDEIEYKNNYIIYGFPNRKAFHALLRNDFNDANININDRIYVRDPSLWFEKYPNYFRLIMKIFSFFYKVMVDASIRIMGKGTLDKLTGDDSSSLEKFSFMVSEDNSEYAMIHRTYDYYKWRIIDNPHINGDVLVYRDRNRNIVGLLAYSIAYNDKYKYISVQDIISTNKKNYKVLLYACLRICAEERAYYFSHWWLDKKPYYDLISGGKLVPCFKFNRALKEKLIIYKTNIEQINNKCNLFISKIHKRY